MTRLLVVISILLLSACDDNLVVNPYLQNPGHNHMTVMVETNGVAPILHYRQAGESDEAHTTMTMKLVAGSTHVFRGPLTNLKPLTAYEYAIETDEGITPIYRFKTWPIPGQAIDEFKLIAISDTQGGHPERFRDIVENGIIKNECKGKVESCIDHLIGLSVAGDLVITGSNKDEWHNDFFAQAEALLPYIPLLPAIGNHDQPLINYLNYFEAPSNGTIFNDLWYRVQYGNLVLLSMNSDTWIYSPDNLAQMKWFTQALSSMQNDDTVDFVLAQFHHPCKSELWIPGESNVACWYSREMEAFSLLSGKTSGHLFGHTHGFSRGQSRDTNHVWLNVATSAGSIDYWGEHEQTDYDQFQKSYDEYGYSIITVNNTQKAPSIRFKRRTGGDDHVYLGYTDEHIRDDLYIPAQNTAPGTPTAIQTVYSEGYIILQATEFKDNDEDKHQASHWQVKAESGNWQIPIVDAWGNKTRRENIYFDTNTQEGVDITQYRIVDLPEGNYEWRVRYRDEHLKWSEWSMPATFQR